MDIVKLIEVARWCVKSDDCDGCPGFSDCPFVGRGAHQVVSICDYYENLLIKQSEFNDRVNGQLIQDRWDERSKVIAEVREWIFKSDDEEIHDEYEFTRDYIESFFDSMEPDKGDKTESEPPKAERNTAREMIEAEITGAEKGGWRELNYLDGLRFAIECLDKPAEPMVSVKAVKDWIINCDWFNEGKIFTNQFDEWVKWLDEQESK